MQGTDTDTRQFYFLIFSFMAERSRRHERRLRCSNGLIGSRIYRRLLQKCRLLRGL